jgi:hypothetical protein
MPAIRFDAAMDARLRCDAFTGEGKQCSRWSKVRDASGRYVCRQHFVTQSTVISVREAEPWDQRGIPAPSKKLRLHILQKLRRKLKAGPKQAGKGGAIYVYCLEGDDYENLYKVGMTSDSVDKRLQSWARKHKGTVLKRVAVYAINQDVSWMERVIHLYLDYCRVYRYPRIMGTGLESVWAATGERLDTTAGCGPPSPRSLLVTEKMIEWFAAPFEDIDAVIQSIH